MSPEQARSEGHLVDGRSDIFSLGVVFYELLTATRPFRGSNTEEVLERIRMLETRPPRQIDGTIPKELERICLKALAKLASDRYNTAGDMAEDLRLFLAESPQAARSPASSSRGAVAPPPGPPAEPPAGSAVGVDSDKPVKIVPKGLRSFDQTDADFFLALLPGPHDRHGLPESIRFWKTRIEETDPESSFRVGIIYGPSGCGKSSLVKAGLLPRLGPAVVKVYVEALGANTEERLLRNLRRQLPGLNQKLGLVKALAALRRGQGLAPGEKVLLVIDQFEQWLHAHGGEKDTELVLALRQCDGFRVQCLVMIRDDFWLAVSRFMHALEVRLVEGENSRLVDLFDARHARKVLAALGIAFGVLPESGRSKEQNDFLDQAVSGLAQDGKVVSVRLALFAEMFKSKLWMPSALREIGGAEGVGVAFLDETFSSPTAPPHHRLLQKTAQRVLAALLPEAGTDIKGHMRSHEELLEASGCRDRAREFDELIALLDGELRLVTPSDPESLEGDGASRTPSAAGARNYQLTHDYLVSSLRTWLTRKQKATRRGRAELKLAALSTFWTAKPESRRLPSLLEFIEIRLYTPREAWNEGQRKMMTAAARFLGLRVLATMVVIALIVFGAYQYHRWFKANELHDQLLRAQIDKVPAIVNDMAPYRQWVAMRLRQDVKNDDEFRRLRASLALLALAIDESQVEYLYDRLINAEPRECDLIRQVLLPHKRDLTEKLWRVVKFPRNAQQYLCAASCLALYAPDDPRWNAAAPDVAASLARVSPFFVKDWTDALAVTQEKLVRPLSNIACDPLRSTDERLTATNVLMVYAPNRAELLTPVLIHGNEAQFDAVFPRLATLGAEPLRLLEAELDHPVGDDPTDPKNELAARCKARAAIALLGLGRPEKVWRLFKTSRDERVRSYLVHWTGRLWVDRQLVIQHWEKENDIGIRSALLLLLGEFPDAGWPEGQRESLIKRLLTIFEKMRDPGLHGASEWLLRKWRCDDALNAAIERLKKNQAEQRADRAHDRRQWYVNRQGQTFVIVDAREPFTMGSPESEPEREDNERQHRRRIGRCYQIAATPVTKAQFERFRKDCPHVLTLRKKDMESMETVVKTDDSAQVGMTWYEAAEYCNWLSKEQRIKEDQWCYKPNDQGKFAEGMRAKEKYLTLTGYRLPTEAEWEFACRAGTTTRFYYGQNEALLASYAWYRANGDNRTSPVANKKPNDFGLFDMHGNVWQWCESQKKEYLEQSSEVVDDEDETAEIANNGRQVVRGGSYRNLPGLVRAAARGFYPPDSRQKFFGFRPVRTINCY